MPTLNDAIEMISRMITNHDITIAEITPAMALFIMMSVLIVVLKDFMDEFCDRKHTMFHHQNVIVRWSVYIVMVGMILTCGVFDASQFIYVNF